MILVILAIGILMTVGGFALYNSSSDYDECGPGISIIGIIVTIIAFIATVIIGVGVSELVVIDDKIAMYEEENTAIEEQIDIVVKQYQEYETEIFANSTPESAITLVSLYPELKSDTLVASQIEVYVSNNQKIKELKETRINGDVYRWWLYFGGKESKNGDS